MTTHEQGVLKLKRTPLYEQHRALGARLVEFSGWEMPVQYSSILAEHEAVRTHAGLFDVSHMGEFKVEGAGALAFLQSLVPNDVARLAIQQALYTQFCKDDGNVIDDLLIYRLAEEQYMLVVNAANIEKDLAWVKHHGQHLQGVTITDPNPTGRSVKIRSRAVAQTSTLKGWAAVIRHSTKARIKAPSVATSSLTSRSSTDCDSIGMPASITRAQAARAFSPSSWA